MINGFVNHDRIWCYWLIRKPLLLSQGDLGRKEGFKLLLSDGTTDCSGSYVAQRFFGRKSSRICSTSWMMLLALSLGFMPISSETAATTIQKAALWKMSMGRELTCVSLQLVSGLSSGTMFFGLPFGQLRPRVDYIDEELGFVSKRQAKARFRDQILKGWDYKCAYCREHLGKSGTLDHVRPKSKGGETSASNLVAACFNCNVRKSSNDWKDWFRMQHFWEPHLEDAIGYWLSQ